MGSGQSDTAVGMAKGEEVTSDQHDWITATALRDLHDPRDYKTVGTDGVSTHILLPGHCFYEAMYADKEGFARYAAENFHRYRRPTIHHKPAVSSKPGWVKMLVFLFAVIGFVHYIAWVVSLF